MQIVVQEKEEKKRMQEKVVNHKVKHLFCPSAPCLGLGWAQLNFRDQ